MKQGDSIMLRVLNLVRGAGALAALACCALPALGADLGAAPGFKDEPAFPVWRGFYVGLNAGGVVDGQAMYDFTPGVTTPFATNPANVEGWLVGLQAGDNAQFGRIVTGIEADADFLKTNVPTYSIWEGGNLSTSVNEAFSLRGRLGYTVTPRVLFYGTGGYAMANVEHSLHSADPHLGALFTDSSTVQGWVAGGGFEYMHSSRLSFGIEALHYDFGQEHFDLTYKEPPVAVVIPTDISTQMTTVRGRISFHLD